MMDAILAVAIGGNALSGGKFSLTGSIIGAYTIEVLNKTLLRLDIETETIKAFKAVFIIILMAVASPVTRNYARKILQCAGKVLQRIRAKGLSGTELTKDAADSKPDTPVNKEE
jgi:hypothetical protein